MGDISIEVTSAVERCISKDCLLDTDESISTEKNPNPQPEQRPRRHTLPTMKKREAETKTESDTLNHPKKRSKRRALEPSKGNVDIDLNSDKNQPSCTCKISMVFSKLEELDRQVKQSHELLQKMHSSIIQKTAHSKKELLGTDAKTNATPPKKKNKRDDKSAQAQEDVQQLDLEKCAKVTKPYPATFPSASFSFSPFGQMNMMNPMAMMQLISNPGLSLNAPSVGNLQNNNAYKQVQLADGTVTYAKLL